MPLVSQYAQVEKWCDGAYKRFFPLRAVGLACEKGHKLCAEKGLGSVTVEDVSIVQVAGALNLFDEGRWRKARACRLQLRGQDASLSHRILLKHRVFLHDMGLNIWNVDKQMVDHSGSFDLICDFSTQRNFGVSGMVWVELKIMRATGFTNRLQSHMDYLANKIKELSEPSIETVLLVATRVEKAGNGWGNVNLVAKLWNATAETWDDVSPSGVRIARGQIKLSQKPALSEVWANMEFHDSDAGTEMGLFSQFLSSLKLPITNTGKRAKTMNRMLRKAGSEEKIRKMKIASRAGDAPWMGSKVAFRLLYKLL